MPDPTRSHWTSDEELLEQYVLGQLTPARRETLDEHLKTCERCRTRVADERLLSAGIRAAGRKELRRDLADRIARRSVYGTTGVWRWMAAAAVLVAAVGVWRMLSPVVSPPVRMPTMTESRPAPPSEASKQSEPASTSGSAPGPLEGERRAERTDLVLAPDEPRPAAPPAAGVAVASAEAPREVMADAVEPETEEKVLDEAGRLTATSAEAWVEATVLVPAPVNAQKMARSEIDRRAKDAKVGHDAVRPEAGTTGPMSMQLQQAPRSSLPLDQQLQASSSGRVTIPAKLTLVGDSLFIQLYPSTPYSEMEILKASISRPRTDSLVVYVGRQLLGLRIPQDLLAK